MWPFTGTQTQSNTCKVTPQITALSYLMCDLENVKPKIFSNDMCKVTGAIEITVGMH